MDGFGVKLTPDGKKLFQRWARGDLVLAQPVVAQPRCRLELDRHPWMFHSKLCINGLAHGTGVAVRLDGEAFVTNGRFVLGKMIDGEVQALTLNETP